MTLTGPLTGPLTGLLAAAFLLVAPLAASAQQQNPAANSAVGYPNNPQATPQAGNQGAPVPTDRAACPADAKCPDSPAASPVADTDSPGKPPSGGVRTPATAYPSSPVQTPATNPAGTAPR